jgi:hypothetical protein
VPSVTLSVLQSRVYARLDDNSQLYSQAEVNSIINECLRVINLHTGLFQASIQVPTFSQAGCIWYDTPATIIFPLRVQFEDTYLQKYSPKQMAMLYPAWSQDTTASTGLPVSNWVTCGFNKFGIHPADSIGGAAIFVTGVQEPTLLISQSDIVAMPNEYTEALVMCAAHTLMLKETGKLFKTASLVFNDYQRIMKKLSIWKGYTQPRYWVEASQQA